MILSYTFPANKVCLYDSYGEKSESTSWQHKTWWDNPIPTFVMYYLMYYFTIAVSWVRGFWLLPYTQK